MDFVASLGSEKIYVQSALNVDNPEKMAQEKRPLKNIGDSYQKILVTKNGLNRNVDDDGIITVDLFEFLRGEES